MKKFDSYLNNPYKIEGIEERSFITKEGETLTMDPETGEYYVMRKIAKDKTMPHDKLTYTKFFVSSFSRLMTLSPSSLRVMFYMMTSVKPLSTSVILNPPDVCEACQFSPSTFINVITDLLDNKIIAKKLGSSIEFWIDPNIFFNGNRLRIYK
jgi:hypothetical protein